VTNDNGFPFFTYPKFDIRCLRDEAPGEEVPQDTDSPKQGSWIRQWVLSEKNYKRWLTDLIGLQAEFADPGL
jgi:hypothetical protein